MTTVSGTSGSTYVAPTTTSTADTTSTAATTPAKTPYDGTAAVAQAVALANQQLNSGASGSNGNLLGLSPDILSLLQGSDSGGLNSLFGGGSGNAFFSAQSMTALYGAQQARNQATQATSPIDKIIAANNAILNANTAATLAVSKAATGTATTTDTSSSA